MLHQKNLLETSVIIKIRWMFGTPFLGVQDTVDSNVRIQCKDESR